MQDGIISVCTPERDNSRASWVVERCRGPLCTVNRWVPDGFEEYIQICPPAWRFPVRYRDYEFSPSDRPAWLPRNLTPVRWSDVAAERGHIIGDHTAYQDLTPHVDPKSAQPGDIMAPLEETPTGAMIDAIGDAVLSFSGHQQECIVAVWCGYNTKEINNLRHQNASAITRMGQQDYLVLSAPLGTIIRKWRSLLPDEPVSESSVASLSPQAIWPTTGDWFCAVPFDWNSTFFAGPSHLVERLLSDERIESYPVSISADYRH